MKIILGVITARGGSKGIPRKNIKLLGSKPLIAYTIDAAKQSKLMTDVIVSTDDEEIAEFCKKYGANVPFLRPAELAQDKTPHVPVLQHAVDCFEKQKNLKVDVVVILQPTSPFRSGEDIDKTLEKLFETGFDSAVSLVEITENHPTKIKKIEGGKVLPYCLEEVSGTRRQDLPVAYKRSCAVYAIKRDVLMERSELYGDSIAGYVAPKNRSVDIDEPIDWVKAEFMLEQLKKDGYKF